MSEQTTTEQPGDGFNSPITLSQAKALKYQYIHADGEYIDYDAYVGEGDLAILVRLTYVFDDKPHAYISVGDAFNEWQITTEEAKQIIANSGESWRIHPDEKIPAGHVNITPNFANLFKQFLRETELHANQTLQHCVKVNYRGDTITDCAELSRFRNFIVSLNIAVQSATNLGDLAALREVIHQISTKFVLADDKAKIDDETNGEEFDQHNPNENEDCDCPMCTED